VKFGAGARAGTGESFRPCAAILAARPNQLAIGLKERMLGFITRNSYGASGDREFNAPAVILGSPVMSAFQRHSDSFNPETLALLESVLDETWASLQPKDTFDELEMRTAIAELIVQFAAQGERDPQKLKALVLAALPTYAEE
jgi:hypothetical protein